MINCIAITKLQLSMEATSDYLDLHINLDDMPDQSTDGFIAIE